MSVKRAPIQGYTVEESVEFGFDVYVRISKDKDDNTTSLETQREECRTYCREHGIPISRIFEEDYTGTLLQERRVLMHVRNRYLTGKSMGVVFWRYDRLTREPAHFYILEEEMKKHGIKYECVLQHFEDNATGRLSRDILLALNKYEREGIVIRTGMGRLARAEVKGKCLNGAKPRYGFDFSEDKTKRVVNKMQAEVVVLIFTMRAERNSVRNIARTLNTQGIPSPTGKKWENTTISRILENGKYWYRGVGIAFATKNQKEYRNGKLVRVRYRTNEEDLVFLPDGTVPRIISDELYQKAMEVEEAMKQDSPKANKNPEAFLLRGGFLRCGVCGASMVGNNKKGENGQIIPTYICCKKGAASEKQREDIIVNIRASKIDRIVWEYVLTMVKDVNIVSEAVSRLVETNPLENLEISAKTSLEECERKLKKYWKDYDKEDDDEFRAVIRNRIKEQVNLKKKMEEELVKLKNQKIDHNVIKAKLQAFINWCEKVRCGEDEEVEYQDKRDRLRFLGIQVIIYPDKDTEHERFEITTRPDELVEALECTQIKEPTLQIKEPTLRWVQTHPSASYTSHRVKNTVKFTSYQLTISGSNQRKTVL